MKIAVLPFGDICIFGSKHYSLIGSTFGSVNLNNCTVYGTGLKNLSGALRLRGTPRRIISVRGPRTRAVLLQHNIDCPEHYGDPALLLPLFYSPKYHRCGSVSIIPHVNTVHTYKENFRAFTEEYGCELVDMTSYEKWTDIIDKIAGSSFVMSESLHGLIVAEAYQVPCLWVEFREHRVSSAQEDCSFKFLDFYESIGKFGMESVKLYEGYNFEELMSLKDSWRPGNIDYETLLSYFPFEIKPEFKSRIAEFLSAHKKSPR